MLSKFQIYLIVAAVSLVTGFGSGYYFKGLQVDSAELKEVKVVQVAAAESTDKSGELTAKNADKKDQIQVKYLTKYKEIIKYVPTTNDEKTCVDDSGNTVSRVLTRDAVSVLNDEPPSAVQPTDERNEEGSALTEIGLQELSEHILRIQKQYEDLAADHETLVDYDNWYKEKTRPN